jgi:hypothetical protein
MKKSRVIKRTAIAVAVATVFLLTACGGGGGGGSGFPSSNTNPIIRPDTSDQTYYSSGTLSRYGFTSGSRDTVPFSTPAHVSTFNPYTSDSTKTAVSQQHVVNNLTGDGADSMIVTGRMSQPATSGEWVNSSIQLFTWKDGSFVNDTAKWFPNGTNSILGAEYTGVHFADFFKTGRTDMLIVPATDMNYYGPTGSSQAWLFSNTGSQFNLSTVELGAQVWGHGSTIADLTKSGWMDAIITDYGPNTTFLMNNRVNGFTVYQAQGNNDLFWGASSIAAADFLNNGSTQLVATDSRACVGATAWNGCGSSTTKMYTWAIDSITNKLSINWAKDLPAPILGNSSHNYLVINYDFNNSGNQSLILFSSPGTSGGVKQSAIQFLQNDGAGNFTDVTTTMVTGYNTNTYGTYRPQFVDLGNGFKSMILSGTDWSGTANSSTQILIKQSATGPYVAAFQNIITDFASQANLIAGTVNSGNQVAVVKDKSNNLYLVSTLQWHNDATSPMRMSTYLSLIGGQVNPVTAQTAFNAVKATWPWMSSAQVNQVLAQTSSTYLTDAGSGLVLNPDKLLSPVGALSIATRAGAVPLNGITGGIAGVNMSGFNQMQAFDSLGRNYSLNFATANSVGPNGFTFNTEHIDQYNLTSHTEYMLNGSTNTVYNQQGMAVRLGAENRNQSNIIGAPLLPKEFGEQSVSMYPGPRPTNQWSFGLPEIYKRGNFSTGLQFTSLNTNPWLNFTGSFGSVTSSNTLEQVMTYQKNRFTVQGALMMTTTNFKPGIITDVSPIFAGWVETGYRYNELGFGDLGLYMGVKPVVLSGNVTATIPTGVDNLGNPVYTNTKLGVVGQTTPYVRALYTGIIDRHNAYRLSGMATHNGQYRAMAEYRYTF